MRRRAYFDAKRQGPASPTGVASPCASVNAVVLSTDSGDSELALNLRRLERASRSRRRRAEWAARRAARASASVIFLRPPSGIATRSRTSGVSPSVALALTSNRPRAAQTKTNVPSLAVRVVRSSPSHPRRGDHHRAPSTGRPFASRTRPSSAPPSCINHVDVRPRRPGSERHEGRSGPRRTEDAGRRRARGRAKQATREKSRRRPSPMGAPLPRHARRPLRPRARIPPASGHAEPAPRDGGHRAGDDPELAGRHEPATGLEHGVGVRGLKRRALWIVEDRLAGEIGPHDLERRAVDRPAVNVDHATRQRPGAREGDAKLGGQAGPARSTRPTRETNPSARALKAYRAARTMGPRRARPPRPVVASSGTGESPPSATVTRGAAPSARRQRASPSVTSAATNRPRAS